jgi:hypothetical protein
MDKDGIKGLQTRPRRREGRQDVRRQKLESEGKADKAAGKVENAVGGLKDAVRGK